MKTRMMAWLREETVLVVSALLAAGSCLLVKPDEEYLSYFWGNMDTILILFCLMTVVAGLRSLGVFRYVGHCLLEKIRSERGIVLLLVFLCFLGSMVITNDVALITFVPFGMIVLQMCGKEKLVIPLVVLQTIAANMGSSLTPIGNPQNLYLYGQSGAKVGDFLLWMLPYTLVTGICIGLAVLFQKKEKVDYRPEKGGAVWGKKRKFYFISYAVLFLFCLLSVAKVLSPMILFFVTLAFLLAADRRILRCIDYALLGTFIGFFIFIGNLGRVSAFRDFFAGILTGHETLAGVISSQVISNVPAALLLSGFTDKWESLVVGTNLGGLGTLIASMASLISYKQMVRQYPGLKGKYFLYFTLGNVGMLFILLGVYAVLGAF